MIKKLQKGRIVAEKFFIVAFPISPIFLVVIHSFKKDFAFFPLFLHVIRLGSFLKSSKRRIKVSCCILS